MKTNKQNTDKYTDKDKPRSQEPENSSNTRSEDKPLPGEYPASEDIMNRMNEMQRVNVDPDSLSRNPGASNIIREKKDSPDVNSDDDANLTREDFEALGPRDLSLDGGDDEQLKHRVHPVDFGASDLDVPNGDPDKRDALGQGDEENDHYSLGGDDKENLEEDPTRTFG